MGKIAKFEPLAHTFLKNEGLEMAERIGGVAEFKAENATDADIDGWVRDFADQGISVKASK